MTEDVIPGLVSTIIPVFNRPTLLREAVASVLAQDYRPIEIIIVDDGSTDSTAAVMAELSSQYEDVVRAIRQENSGVGAARERGRQAARGEFLQYLDSDDLLLPGKFRLQVKGLNERADCGVAYGRTIYRRADGLVEPNPWKDTGVLRETMFPSFLQSRWWETATPLYRSNLCAEAGPWTNLRLEEDWEYDCRIASLGVRLVFCDAFVAEHRDLDAKRLSKGVAYEPERMRHRARAHELILGHALAFGIDHEAPEMKHFARELFLLSRQCGAAGLSAESQHLFNLSRDASGKARARGIDFILYRIASAVIGWRALGIIACAADRFRH